MPKIVNLDLNKIKELWETTSLSQGDIAKEVNTSIDTVRRRIKSNNWIRPNNLIEEEKNNRNNKIMSTKEKKGLTDAHDDNEEETFKDLYYNTNLSKPQIAEKMGVRLSRVKHLIEKLDVKRTEEHIKKVKQEVNKELFKDSYNFAASKDELDTLNEISARVTIDPDSSDIEWIKVLYTMCIFMFMVFILESGSILFMKLYNDAFEEKERMLVLRKLGISGNTLKKSVSKELKTAYEKFK